MISVLRPIAYLIVTAVLVFALCPFASAEIPQIISYQGKVTDTGGTPVSDGTYDMRFSIYDVASGGTALWYSGTLNVQVTSSIFNVLLGESPPAITLPFDEDYWLGVWIEGDTQTPRQRLGSVGFSYMASGLVPGTEVNGSITTGTSAALKAVNTASTGTRYGIYGESTSTQNVMYGVYGKSASTSGRGVLGEATATSGNAYGVYGTAASIIGRGVFGEATATSGTSYGVHGTAAATAGRGVFGEATATSGTSHGVSGKSLSTDGYGVYGETTANTGVTFGVRGMSYSTSGTGVSGSALATTGPAFGGKFQSESESGVGAFGLATAIIGTAGGMSGRTYAESGRGVFGWASSDSGTTYGVYGRSDSPAGTGVYYQGGLAGSGSKSCVVRTSSGPTLMYCQESPENWFEDFGEGQLIDGRCHIELDPLFLETVTINSDNPMKTFLTPNGRLGDWWVEKGTVGFSVIAPDASDGSRFDYRVVAKRKNFETKRLDYCKAAENDSYLYPDLREKELRELEDERARLEEERRRLEEERVQSVELIQATRD